MNYKIIFLLFIPIITPVLYASQNISILSEQSTTQNFFTENNSVTEPLHWKKMLDKTPLSFFTFYTELNTLVNHLEEDELAFFILRNKIAEHAATKPNGVTFTDDSQKIINNHGIVLIDINTKIKSINDIARFLADIFSKNTLTITQNKETIQIIIQWLPKIITPLSESTSTLSKVIAISNLGSNSSLLAYYFFPQKTAALVTGLKIIACTHPVVTTVVGIIIIGGVIYYFVNKPSTTSEPETKQ
jgi:hypothetical protein